MIILIVRDEKFLQEKKIKENAKHIKIYHKRVLNCDSMHEPNYYTFCQDNEAKLLPRYIHYALTLYWLKISNFFD